MTLVSLVALVMALVALSRTGKRGDLMRRIGELEDEVRALRKSLPDGLAPAEAPAEAAAATATRPAAAAVEIPAAAGGEATAADATRADGDVAEEATGEARLSPSPSEPSYGADASATATAPAPPAPSGGGGSSFEWERWLGVRGAALLGGAVLALAGLFFFRYSIEHGLIPPWLRVVMGTATGIAAIAGAEWALRTRYAGTANGLAGGGIVVLYAAFWAAGVLYELIPPGALFFLLVLVTAAGCALSWRHDSLAIAVIGLVGGFLTPLFASTGSDRPIGLFAYILMLDVGLLAIARRKRWSVLAVLALAGTAIYQLLWIGTHMGSDDAVLAVAILAVFALLFVLAVPSDAGERNASWRLSQVAAVLVPFGFALYFAATGSLAVGIVPLGALLVVLGLAAGWLARVHGEGAVALGAAGATVAVLAAWATEHDGLGASPWTTAIALVLVVAAYRVAHEIELGDGNSADDGLGDGNSADDGLGGGNSADDGLGDGDPAHDGMAALAEARPRTARDAAGQAGAIVGIGAILLLDVVGIAKPQTPWPLVCGWIGIALLLARETPFAGRAATQVAASVGVGLGLAAYHLVSGEGGGPAPTEGVLLATMLATAILWQVVAIARRGGASHAPAEHAAAALAIVLALGLLDVPRAPLPGLGTPFALGFLALLAATRLGGGPWMVVAPLAVALVHLVWSLQLHPHTSSAGLSLAALSAVAFTAWPFAASQRLREDAWAWRASAMAGALWLPGLLVLYEDRFTDRAIGVVPLALGALAMAAAARARDLWPADDPRRISALAWLCGAAIALLTLAIPLQVEREWITIGWALEGLALIVLWTRLDHPGLKLTALALLAAATVRLVGNAEVLAYHARSQWRIVNWIAYTYLVPAAALAWSARLLRPLELPRLREWERPLYLRPQPLGAAAAGLAALVVVFVWINLAIADWFASGEQIRLLADLAPAQKLTTSIAWAVYAIALLALGVRLASGALRWASLVLLMVTIAKIFLYDVGELTDLYRVGALLGLAISLIAVSLVYQRFVFRRPAIEGGGS